jgi:hypothetical protein
MMQNYIMKFMANYETNIYLIWRKRTMDKAIWTALYPQNFIQILARFEMQVLHKFCFTQ